MCKSEVGGGGLIDIWGKMDRSSLAKEMSETKQRPTATSHSDYLIDVSKFA